MKENDTSLNGYINLEGFLRTKRNNISRLAKIGNMDLVQRFLSEKITFNKSNEEENKSSQLYMACFWGDKDAVRTLISRNANLNHANAETLWTPLHAATFNEHGMIVMILLENNADPMLSDYKGRTPIDFASTSEIIWPHFAALGYQKTSKQELIDLEVLECRAGHVPKVKNNEKYGPPDGDILGKYN